MRIAVFLSLCLCSLCFAASHFSECDFDPWGCDTDLLSPQKNTTHTTQFTHSLVSKVGQSMIRFFQHRISPIDGPRSSYYPSSSEYTLLAIQKYGLLCGIALGCDRLMRENGEEWIYELTFNYDRLLKYDPVR